MRVSDPDSACELEKRVNSIDERVGALDSRVDRLDTRMAVIESTQGQMRGEMKEGFSDVKNQLTMYGEQRAKWSEWARSSLSSVGKWCAKYGGVIIVAAIGMGNADKIVSAVRILFY